MAPLFWLKITDWKKESAQVSDPKYLFSDCFSSTVSKTKVKVKNSYESLKYFDNEANLDDVNKVKSELNSIYKKIIPGFEYDPFKLFSDFVKSYAYLQIDIIASRSIVSRIMNTPFEINQDKRKWIIKAELIGNENGIYLYYDKDQEPNITENMANQYEVLKRYLFVKYPLSYHRNELSVFNEIFGQLFYIELCENINLYYTTEIPGVISECEITKKKEFVAAEQIYCDIFEDGELSQDVINYNPIWWSKAALSKAKQCILASYDKDNDGIKDIYKFNMDKFEDKTKYENLWSPDAAWNFLNNFIRFLRNAVNSVSDDVKKKCVWKFESFPNDEPIVSCEILFRKTENGQETLKPLTLDANNFQ